MFWKPSVLEKTEGNKDFCFTAKLKVIPGKPSVLFWKNQNRRKTEQKEIKGPQTMDDKVNSIFTSYLVNTLKALLILRSKTFKNPNSPKSLWTKEYQFHRP